MRLKRTIAIVLVVTLLAPALLGAQEKRREEERGAGESYMDGRLRAEDEHSLGGKSGGAR